MTVEIEPLEHTTQLLEDLLSQGPLPTDIVRAHLEANDIPKALSYQAREDLGIVSVRRPNTRPMSKTPSPP